ncbi:GAF domain-containing sensor histidine kinase [Cytobacillus sp. S13-E01]|uniref:GAF domain-containing sensor histidine kinase n=1 Tax=Cytobacillus sp. S13-E01 TaxID=3031326 RepID=UPI0023D8713C|nr:GAF domain-containing sensor histidine kinase [Cytobacillus sp. S13-E01]MDF0727027.1 GAF domain-containing sensor histidine kinase [Cytobacillus sp. S13-E01]
MNQNMTLQHRENYSKLYMTSLSIIGWIIIIASLFRLEEPRDFLVFFLLIGFLAVCEYYPMPVYKGFTSIVFPFVYVLYILFGLSNTIIVFAGVVLVVNIVQRRPFRTICFNPAQYIISLIIAEKTVAFMELSFLQQSTILSHITEYFLLLTLFYFFNNVFVDLVLLIRPQPYRFSIWKQKTLTELSSGLVALVYGSLLFLLGSQNRGDIDVFSYFFFFSPLVGLSLLSSVIVRLKNEKKRLDALFSITSELNRMLPAKEWLATLKDSINDFIKVEASILWIKEDGIWKKRMEDGPITKNFTLTQAELHSYEHIKNPLIFNDRRKTAEKAGDCFSSDIKAIVYTPLVIENETVGMFVVGRSRVRSFEENDIRSIATLANQLAAVIKTRMLFTEKEKRILLEERNRIARDIHDGVAQTMAGAVMKLETAQRKYRKHPEEAMNLVNDSVNKLRSCLKEVRESIYALRPYPTERVGLIPAITRKIESIKGEFPEDIQFEIRGEEIQLSSMVEKVLFDTCSESLQNCIKHATATRIDILLSFQTEHILLKVKDNGKGFSLFQAMIKAQNQPHFGILQMNDASDKINASLQIDSKEGSGTEITLTVPKMGLEGGFIDDQAHVSG